ncbi:unnamed protein product [Ectocarpus sp. 6 AP-2014]
MPMGAGNDMGSLGREGDKAIAVLSGTRVKIQNANGTASSTQGEECRQPGRRWQRNRKTSSCERPIPRSMLMSTLMLMVMVTITSGRMHGGGAWCSCLVVCSFVVLRAVRMLRAFGCCHLLRFFGDMGTAAVLTHLGGVLLLLLPTVDAGQCAFTQECFQFGLDTDCTPIPAEGDTAVSFPMDSSHGFGVFHDKVWDGSVEDPSTGLCDEGRPDSDGRCIVDFVAPKGLKDVAPIVCPQYKDSGCCSWQQNYALYQNLGLLVESFGSTTGCLACAVNLVNFWCALVCSPDQGAFASMHDPPFDQRRDDLTGGSSRVLQLDVNVDGDMACRIYESCKSIAVVGETTAMQSGLGLLKFQLQTGAVGHGEFFFPSFETNASAESPCGNKRLPVSGSLDALASEREDDPQVAASAPTASSEPSSMSFDTLACDSFYDPGSSTIPFAYPPKREDIISCTCDYCVQACSGGGSIDVDVSDKNPIPVLDGFGVGLVGGVYAAVVACSLALFWWRRNQKKKPTKPAAAGWATIQHR